MGKQKAARYRTIVDDLRASGYNFRINDLDESLEYSVSQRGEWERVTDVIESVIRTDMREIGYGVSGSGKSGFSAMRDAMMTLAHRQRYNAILEYFKSLDGKYEPGTSPYVNEHFCKHFTNPDEMFPRWLFRWMVGAIAKIHRAERNAMLVLDGPQFMGKSYFAKWLCPLPEHFIRDSLNPDDKDSHLRLSDMMVWEVAEVDSSTRRADASAMKAILSVDRVQKRPAYGRHRLDKPAICSFIGTINFDGSGFLVDSTGNTRFLTCLITAIDFGYSTAYSPDDLWSEAWWYYKNVPGSWELTPEEQAKRDEINQSYEVPSALEEVILDLFQITHNGQDFIPTSTIKNTLALHYRINSEQLFTRELKRVMHKLGVEPGRAPFREGEGHKRGYKGIVNRPSNDHQEGGELF